MALRYCPDLNQLRTSVITLRGISKIHLEVLQTLCYWNLSHNSSVVAWKVSQIDACPKVGACLKNKVYPTVGHTVRILNKIAGSVSPKRANFWSPRVRRFAENLNHFFVFNISFPIRKQNFRVLTHCYWVVAKVNDNTSQAKFSIISWSDRHVEQFKLSKSEVVLAAIRIVSKSQQIEFEFKIWPKCEMFEHVWSKRSSIFVRNG